MSHNQGQAKAPLPARQTIMSQESTRVTDQLREKIRSKMDVAKFFGTFITLLIALLLGAEKGLSSLTAKLGVVSLLGAAGFCIAAVFAYDRLLMPQKYGGDSAKNAAEPEFQDTLEEMMVKAWSRLFVPAVAFFAAGVILSVFEPLGLPTLSVPALLAETSVWTGLAVSVAAPLIVGWVGRPKIKD